MEAQTRMPIKTKGFLPIRAKLEQAQMEAQTRMPIKTNEFYTFELSRLGTIKILKG